MREVFLALTPGVCSHFAMIQTYEGGCHCGRVRFTVTGDLDEALVCNCSVCTMKGFLHLIVPADCFRLHTAAQAVTTYVFGTGVARHLFCTVCGIAAYYVPRSDPDKIDVNVRCLDNVDLQSLSPSLFDGRDWKAALLTRRQRTP